MHDISGGKCFWPAIQGKRVNCPPSAEQRKWGGGGGVGVGCVLVGGCGVLNKGGD